MLFEFFSLLGFKCSADFTQYTRQMHKTNATLSSSAGDFRGSVCCIVTFERPISPYLHLFVFLSALVCVSVCVCTAEQNQARLNSGV